jgi:hypothetical protein
MPSGKQILLAELQRLSQKRLPKEQLAAATERFRAGLLLHGSTAASAWPTVEKIGWIEEQEGIQGPGLIKENIYLADLVNALKAETGIPEAVKKLYPDLSLKAYRAGLHVIWLLLAQLYYQESLSSVENDGVLDRDVAEKWVLSCMDKLKCYREDPEGYIGGSVESAESEI